MLDFGCILCFIHTNIRIHLLKMEKHLRRFLQYRIRIKHLVIIIHMPVFAHNFAIRLINRYNRDTVCLFFKLLHLFLCQHTVFDIGDQLPNRLQIALCRVSLCFLLIDL